MKAKQRARELVEKYHDQLGMLWYTSKECALITVEEIMIEIRWKLSYGYEDELFFWDDVKCEIQKL